jgi:enoyl-CoA hydratase
MLTTIQLERSGTRATIILAAPAGKPPTLDPDNLGELERIIGELRAAPPRTVVVRSNQPKYFCVGANVRVLETINEATIEAWVRLGHRVFNQLEDLPCPVIARMTGHAIGGGLELAMSCDLIVAADDARLAQSEAGLGFIPGWGGTFRLVERVGAAQAKRMFFTGAGLDARAASAAGLVDQVVAPDAIDAAVEELLVAVEKNNPAALASFKHIVSAERTASRERCAALEAEASLACVRDPDAKERLRRFLTRRN